MWIVVRQKSFLKPVLRRKDVPGIFISEARCGGISYPTKVQYDEKFLNREQSKYMENRRAGSA